ncbi:deleted in malignant brain tumors 1 protein-like [Mya arenaria]|uniref:deleted in malignant brain tumors 1 protein-like n=1 Tax=Mya arenaria TaxID=6604 RepID=UPI0022E1728C|nr:deleted in malignant brain tumors 1 protein-like [Mya arenaria]
MCVAVCGPPPTEANTVRTINEDGTLTYTCAAYFLPASSSVTLTCQNVGDMKEWSPSAPNLNCYNCGLTAPVVNTVITTNADGSVTYTCSDGYFPTDASLTSETLTCQTDGTFSPSSTPTITCYNCADSPPDVPGATYNHVPGEKTALYTCGSGLRQHPDTTSMEAVCVHEAAGIGTWNHNIECYGVRLVDGEYPNSGFLEVFKGGKWNVVCYDDKWDWQETSVVCKEINPALYQFGGAFHLEYYDKTPVNNENCTRLKDPNCSGSEGAVILCASTESCGPIDPKLGITCYTEDVTATGMYFALGDDPSFVQANVQVDQWYAVWVRYNGTWGRVCSDGFGNDEEDVVCKTVNSAWRGDHTGEDDVIAGQTVIAKTWHCDPATPHFLYCGNKGYNYDSQSCTKVVTVECRI